MESKYPLHIASQTAKRFTEILQPHCERFHIAGSIRRVRHQVKDIEIVCQPNKVEEMKSLFEKELIISKDFIEGLAIITDHVIKGHIEGRYMQIATSSKICPGIKLDLFMPAPADYFRQLVIRTGSRDFVHNIIAAAWKRLGWVGTGEHGLRRVEDCELVPGQHKKWKVINPEGQKPPVWKSEQEVFDWLGIKWMAPADREFTHSLNERL